MVPAFLLESYWIERRFTYRDFDTRKDLIDPFVIPSFAEDGNTKESLN